MSEIKFNGPPPKRAGGTLSKDNFRRILDERPGEWAQKDYESPQIARNRQSYLRVRGYEAAARGKTLYARKPLDTDPTS